MFDTRHYSKENTKNRLLKRSAELWGYDDTQLDSFDPLVRLIIEACAVEFEKLGRDIQTTEFRLLERLAQVLCPEVVNVSQPAYAISTARPNEPISKINPETTFVHKKTGGNKNEANEFHFTPVADFSIANASIRYFVTPQTLYSVENGNSRTIQIETTNAPRGNEKSVWVGLSLNPNLQTFDDFRFYFDWSDDSHKDRYRGFLELSRWWIGDSIAEVVQGLEVEEQTLTSLEKRIIKLVEKSFLTIKSKDKITDTGIKQQPYPPEFETKFGWQSLQILKEPLYWINIEFPQAFPAEGFESMTIALNAFPVLNRKLHKLNYRVQQGITSIPLNSDEAFVGIKSVWNFHNHQFAQNQAIVKTGENKNTFILRHQGVGRFDSRQARELLYQLSELLRDEKMAFSAIGEEYLAALIRELTQNLAKLDQKVGLQKATDSTTHPFVMVRTADKNDNIYVTYWTTLAEQATNIQAGASLSSYSGAAFANNESYLLTRPFGGRPRLSGTQYVSELRKNILTHNRLVTAEDIKTFCIAEVGNEVKKIEIRKHFMMGNTPKKGFERCLQVLLTPTQNSEGINWPQVCESLRLKIETNSAAHLPIQVLVPALNHE